MGICLGLRAVCGATGSLADFGVEFVISTEGSSASMVVRSGCAKLISNELLTENAEIFPSVTTDRLRVPNHVRFYSLSPKRKKQKTGPQQWYQMVSDDFFLKISPGANPDKIEKAGAKGAAPFQDQAFGKGEGFTRLKGVF